MTFESILAFLTEYTEEASAAGGITAVILVIWALIKWPFSKKGQNPAPVPPVISGREAVGNDVAYFINVQKALKADLEQELTTAHEDEKQELRGRITELERQIQDPDAALAEAQKRVADLEARLARMGNDVGGDRLEAARKALAQFDYSVADEIFAEVEARQQLAVEEASRAAFGRGEVAEAEIRWHDAAEHYVRSARLDPGFETLSKASEFSRLAGDYATALTHSTALVDLCRAGESQENLAVALNHHAINLRHLGQYAEAEDLYREALKIDKAMIGDSHPEYATGLNNLAAALEAQGRYAEAEDLYREALKIIKASIGDAHPNYASGLSNLAGVIGEQRRTEEAILIVEQASVIFKSALGENHPNYGNSLWWLAAMQEKQGARDKAGPLYERALEIFLDKLGAEHPDTKDLQIFVGRFRAGG